MSRFVVILIYQYQLSLCSSIGLVYLFLGGSTTYVISTLVTSPERDIRMSDPNRPFSLSTIPQRSSLPQYSIPREEHRAFWCLVLGDLEPFKVSLPLNIGLDIDDLKEVIRIKGIDTTKSTVLPKDLILWKVRMLPEQP